MEIVRLDNAIRVRGPGEEDREELALALATSMVPRLRRWAEAKTRLDSEIWTLESRLEEWRSPHLAGTRGSGDAARIEEERSKLEEQLLRLRTELRKIERRPWSYLRSVWLLIWGNAWRADRAAARRRLAEHESRLEELSTRLSGEVDQLSRELEALHQQRRDTEAIPRVVEGVRALDYVLLPRRIRVSLDGQAAGQVQVRWLLADPFGDPVTVDAPHVAMSAQDLDELAEGLDGLDLGGVLLRHADPDWPPATETRLLGAERQLCDVARGLARFSQTTEARHFSLSIAPPGDSVVDYVTKHLATVMDAAGESVPPELDRESRVRLSEVRKSADAVGAVARSNLHAPATLYSAFAVRAAVLPEVARKANSARGRSAAALSEAVRRARMNAELLRYHMFCPECNAFPAYLAKAYGLTERAVDQLDTKRVANALEKLRDRRLETTEGRKLGLSSSERLALDRRWTAAREELERLEETHRFHRSELQALEKDEAPDTPDARLRRELIEREIRMRQARYREVVLEVQAHPLALADPPVESESPSANPDHMSDQASAAGAGLDPSARLVYEPSAETSPWSCLRCGTTFDGETALLGAVDRLRTDVVYPMLSGLWGHRIVRTGAAKAVAKAAKEISERSEEEASVLQEPVAGFKSDAERLRKQVEEAHARGLAVSRRLLKVAEQYGQFGLLQPEELDQVRRSAQSTLGRMDEIRQALDRLAAAERGMNDTIAAGRRARVAPTPPEWRFLEQDAARLTPLTELDTVPHDAGGPAASAARPAEAVPVAADGPPCAVCGSPAPAQSTFCPGCGATLSGDRAAATPTMDRPTEPPMYAPAEGHKKKPSRTSWGVASND